MLGVGEVFKVGVAQVRRFSGYVEGIDWLRGLVRVCLLIWSFSLRIGWVLGF